MSVSSPLAPAGHETDDVVRQPLAAENRRELNRSSCRTHHVTPQSHSHGGMSPLAEMETVLREEGGVGVAILVRKHSSEFVHQAEWQLNFTWAAQRGTYSIQRHDGVPKKGLHHRCKVLSAVIATAVHQFFSLLLMGSDCKDSLEAKAP